jgi:hypothetical protein
MGRESIVTHRGSTEVAVRASGPHTASRAHERTGKSHIPRNSLFFEKLIPALLALMGLITVAMVLFAAGILLGLIRF